MTMTKTTYTGQVNKLTSQRIVALVSNTSIKFCRCRETSSMKMPSLCHTYFLQPFPSLAVRCFQQITGHACKVFKVIS